MTNEQYQDLQTMRTKINMELFDTDFADADLMKMSINLNKIIEDYDDSVLSQLDRDYKEIRLLLINITKLLEESVKHE